MKRRTKSRKLKSVTYLQKEQISSQKVKNWPFIGRRKILFFVGCGYGFQTYIKTADLIYNDFFYHIFNDVAGRFSIRFDVFNSMYSDCKLTQISGFV